MKQKRYKLIFHGKGNFDGKGIIEILIIHGLKAHKQIKYYKEKNEFRISKKNICI